MAERLEQIDTRIEIVTPENIAFQYRIAGPFRRLSAYLLDLLLRGGIVVAAVIGMAVFGVAGLSGLALGTGLILFFLLDWFYGGVFEALWNGQTPGKWVVGLRVMTVEGQPIQGWQAILRNFLRAADAMPIVGIIPTYQVGFWSCLVSPRLQRLGDFAAGTMVVIDEPAAAVGVQRVTEQQALDLAEQLPKNFRASRSLARAVSLYVQRRHLFSPARRMGIAWQLAEPLRHKLELPAGTNPDLLLCAVYHRTFITDRPDEGPITAIVAPATSPLPRPVGSPVANPDEVVIRM